MTDYMTEKNKIVSQIRTNIRSSIAVEFSKEYTRKFVFFADSRPSYARFAEHDNLEFWTAIKLQRG